MLPRLPCVQNFWSDYLNLVFLSKTKGNLEKSFFWPKISLKNLKSDQIFGAGPKFLNALYDQTTNRVCLLSNKRNKALEFNTFDNAVGRVSSESNSHHTLIGDTQFSISLKFGSTNCKGERKWCISRLVVNFDDNADYMSKMSDLGKRRYIITNSQEVFVNGKKNLGEEIMKNQGVYGFSLKTQKSTMNGQPDIVVFEISKGYNSVKVQWDYFDNVVVESNTEDSRSYGLCGNLNMNAEDDIWEQNMNFDWAVEDNYEKPVIAVENDENQNTCEIKNSPQCLAILPKHCAV